jgi:hypothetical protein
LAWLGQHPPAQTLLDVVQRPAPGPARPAIVSTVLLVSTPAFVYAHRQADALTGPGGRGCLDADHHPRPR